MGRRRQNNHDLPRSVYKKGRCFWFHRAGKWLNLGDDQVEAYAAYRRLTNRSTGGDVPSLIDEALADKLPDLSKQSAKQYKTHCRRLQHHFKNFDITQITAKEIVQLKRGVYRSRPGSFNYLRAALSMVFTYAIECELVDTNPCLAVKRRKVTKRTRLPSFAEYDSVHSAATPLVQDIMDMALLTGQRIGDVLAIKWSHITAEGISFTQQKTGKKLIVQTNTELITLLKRIKERHGNVVHQNLFVLRHKPIQKATFDHHWRKAKLVANVTDFHFHDIRAMAATAAEEQNLDPQSLLGHTTSNQTQTYLRSRKGKLVEGVKFAKINR